MDCSCVAYGQGEGCGPECMFTTIRRARKEHKCVECHEKIHKGEKYEYISGIWDGEPHSYKTCLPCSEIRDTLVEDFLFRELYLALGESFGFDEILPSRCMAKLTKPARDKLCDWIEREWEE